MALKVRIGAGLQPPLEADLHIGTLAETKGQRRRGQVLTIDLPLPGTPILLVVEDPELVNRTEADENLMRRELPMIRSDLLHTEAKRLGYALVDPTLIVDPDIKKFWLGQVEKSRKSAESE